MTQNSIPSIRSLVMIPAIITLAVTALRLSLELGGFSGWIASTEPGGGAALIGVSWLPFIFGPYFALKLAPAFAGEKGLYKRLFMTLVVYGVLARIPVVLVGIGDILGDWGTHYGKFPPEMEDLGAAGKIGMTFVAQLIFWAAVWTPVTGGLLGALVLKIRPAAAANSNPADF